MKEKRSIVLRIGISLSAIIAIAVLFLYPGGLSAFEYFASILVLVLVIGATIIIIKRMRDVKAGLPTEDELAKKVSWKAGAYAYYASIWIAVGLIWFPLVAEIFGFRELTVMEALGTVILLSGAVYIGLYFLFNRKGDV